MKTDKADKIDIRKMNRNEVQDMIKELSNDLSKENIIKIKKLATSKNIKLKELKKRFCKKCLSVFDSNSKIKIKNGLKIIRCKCGYISRYKLK